MRFGAGTLIGLALLAPLTQASAQRARDSWAVSWAAAPAFAVGPELADQTIRQTIRLSVGGSRIRLRFANQSAGDTVIIGAAHLAIPGRAGGSIIPSSDRVVTFNGQRGVSIPPGAPIYSDPLELQIEPLTAITISIFVTRYTGPATIHPDGSATTYMSGEGDFTGATIIPGSTTSTSRLFLTQVEVASAAKPLATVVTLGDSITDGANSTVDANHRWPDRLAERLAASPQFANIGVANAGISGNRILHDIPEKSFGPSALARLDRDVLSAPGLKWVFLLEGINDIGHSSGSRLADQEVSAQEIIAGMRQIIARVGARGAKIIGGTLMPFENTSYSDFFTGAGEAKRQTVNRWIRIGGEFDAIVDFDAALRDPAHPARLRAEFDSGDHIHPNDAGYRKMAEIVDLTMFQ